MGKLGYYRPLKRKKLDILPATRREVRATSFNRYSITICLSMKRSIREIARNRVPRESRNCPDTM